jgi:aspartate dehydrogenase
MGDEPNSERRSKQVTVGLLGLGSIGLSVVQLLQGESGVRVVGALVRRPGVRDGSHDFPIVHSLNDLLALHPDVIAEVAGHAALKAYGPTILRSQIDLVIASAGALADQDFLTELQAAASVTGRTVEIVAGAIGALDAISAAAVGGLDRVTYLVRRPPDQPLPQVTSDNLSAETGTFSGSAREAALKFPDNLNVVAALGFAGLGLDRTAVRVVVDPTVDNLHHEIVATGHFGQLNLSVANNDEGLDGPSQLVAMSVVRALQSRLWTPIRIV